MTVRLATALPPYAELRCSTNFSFLKGASWPEELVARAKQLGYSALAVTDECSVAGIVRAHVAAKEHKLKLLIGSQFAIQCDSPFTLVVLACNLNGYGNLCEFITKLRRSSEKGTQYWVLMMLKAWAVVLTYSPMLPVRPRAAADWMMGTAASSVG
jgi:error-prone DNA polymerase